MQAWYGPMAAHYHNGSPMTVDQLFGPPPSLPVGPKVPGSYGAPNAFNEPLGVYSPQPNVYSPQPGGVYSATRDSFKTAPVQPPPPGVDRLPPNSAMPAYKSFTMGPKSVSIQASGSHPPTYPDGTSGAGYGWTGAPIPQKTVDEGKLSVSIDFGESSAPDFLLSTHK